MVHPEPPDGLSRPSVGPSSKDDLFPDGFTGSAKWFHPAAGLVSAVPRFPDNTTVRALDGVSAQLLGSVGVGLMLIVLELHTDMFAGQGGKLFAAC